MHTPNLLKLTHFMNWSEEDYQIWSIPVVFASTDLLTTYIGLQFPNIIEANIFVNNFSGAEFWVILIFLKFLAIALGIFYYEYFDFNKKELIPIILGVIWAIVSINNIIHIYIAV